MTNEMNTIENLYYGNIRPCDKSFDQDFHYAKFMKVLSKNEEKLTAFLESIPGADEEQLMFSQIMIIENKLIEFLENERFMEGFRMGANIMLDTFVYPRQSVLNDII